jgi:hypothetical protein
VTGTYALVNVPTPVHASFLGLVGPLVDTEMPVHMGNLLLLPGLIISEASTALSARLT